MLRLRAADNGTSSHPHWPLVLSLASGHTPPCNLNVQLLVLFFSSADNFFALHAQDFSPERRAPC